MNNDTDEYLMTCFRDHRDYRRFEELTERYAAKGLGVARHYLFDASSAEDAVQEAFIKIVRSSNQFKAGALFAPWFYRILRNICFDFLRKKRAHAGYMEQYSSERPETKWPADSEQAFDSKALLAQLPEPEREVLVMKIYQEMTFAEIALVLDSSIEAVKKRSQRGLQHLKAHYDRSRRQESVAI